MQSNFPTPPNTRWNTPTQPRDIQIKITKSISFQITGGNKHISLNKIGKQNQKLPALKTTTEKNIGKTYDCSGGGERGLIASILFSDILEYEHVKSPPTPPPSVFFPSHSACISQTTPFPPYPSSPITMHMKREWVGKIEWATMKADSAYGVHKNRTCFPLSLTGLDAARVLSRSCTRARHTVIETSLLLERVTERELEKDFWRGGRMFESEAGKICTFLLLFWWWWKAAWWRYQVGWISRKIRKKREWFLVGKKRDFFGRMDQKTWFFFSFLPFFSLWRIKICFWDM